MGIHDRDWYREDYASKNGMRYDRSTATYSAADSSDSTLAEEAVSDPSPRPSAPPHWSLKLVVWLALAVFLAVLYRFNLR